MLARTRQAMPARLVSNPGMKRNGLRDKWWPSLEEALAHALEVGVIGAMIGGVAVLYSLGVLR